MSSAKAFGSITIQDITDVGRLSVYLTSNQPQTVIEDPNQNETQKVYVPNWDTSHLKITPVIYFNDQLLKPSADLKVTWKRKDGSSEPTTLKNFETPTANNVTGDLFLTVTRNCIVESTTGLLTYIAYIDYTDPDTRVTLHTQAQMSFTLVKHASIIKKCSIVGESVFLINRLGQTSPDSITLTAETTTVTPAKWQYKNSTGEFVDMTNTNNASINGNSIVIKPTEAILFNNDVCTIRLVSSDDKIYDIHSITKIRDGVNGDDNVALVLSNESHTFPCDSKGNIRNMTGADTTLTIYEGSDDVTDNNGWNINVEESSGLTGTYDSKTHIYTINSLTVDMAHADFKCTNTKYPHPIIRRFSVSKQYAGLDGKDAVLYHLTASSYTLNVAEDGAISPSNVTFSAYKQVGNKTVEEPYQGRFKVYEDGSLVTPGGITDANTKVVHTPSSGLKKVIKCELYDVSGENLLDVQSVLLTKDGKKGETGAAGEHGVSVILGNEAEVIACNANGTVKAFHRIEIPFYGYYGTKRIAVDCTVNTKPSGTKVTSTPSTASEPGKIVYEIPVGNDLGDSTALSGTFNFSFTCHTGVRDVKLDKKFAWSKNIQASAVLQIFAPQGDVIVNGKNNVVLNTQLTDGVTIVDTGVTYKWTKFKESSYVDIEGAVTNQSSLTVKPNMVDSMASFRCAATYGGKTYYAYWTVIDKNDPIELVMMASAGTQLSQNTPYSIVYTLAYVDGVEIDAIKSTRFSTEAPASAAPGDFYYHVNTELGTVTLKKYIGSKWQDAPVGDLPKGTYNYYTRNYKGEANSDGPWKTGHDKAVYVDRDIVQKGLMISCEANINI